MIEALEVMKWPLLACLLLPGLLVYLGLHIVRREIIFVDLALAQVAALGACVAILLGHHDKFVAIPFSQPLAGLFHHGTGVVEPFHIPLSYFWSFGFTLIGAAIFTLTKTHEKHRVPQEALIGIVYVVAAALAILLLSRSAEGKEELQRTLVGEVLLVQPQQVLGDFVLFLFIAGIHYLYRDKFFALSFDPDRAQREGWSERGWDFLFYALFGWVVTSFVEIGGVLLVFSYLIVPAVCANFLATRFRVLLAIGWSVATLGSVAGLFASYQWDFPTGAAIVCVLGALLVIAAAAAKLLNRRHTPEKNSA